MRGPTIAPDRDQLAHREVHVVAGIEIAHRRDAGFERPPRVVLREIDRDRRQPRRCPRGRVPGLRSQ